MVEVVVRAVVAGGVADAVVAVVVIVIVVAVVVVVVVVAVVVVDVAAVVVVVVVAVVAIVAASTAAIAAVTVASNDWPVDDTGCKGGVAARGDFSTCGAGASTVATLVGRGVRETSNSSASSRSLSIDAEPTTRIELCDRASNSVGGVELELAVVLPFANTRATACRGESLADVPGDASGLPSRVLDNDNDFLGRAVLLLVSAKSSTTPPPARRRSASSLTN